MSIRIRLAAALAIASFSTLAQADNVRGAWSQPFSWPLIAAHAVLTPDGRVLTYGTDGSGQQTGYFIYDVWDPQVGASAAGHLTLPNGTATDIFCSSQLILPQSGNIFLAGGDNWTGSSTTNTGNNNTNVFNPLNNTLARGENMSRARWYSSSTTLLNGETYIQGGTGGADLPEIRGLNGSLRLMWDVDTSSLAPNYPRNWLAPDGRVFGFDNTGRMYYVWPASTGLLTTAGQLPGATSWTSSAVMFQPGKILQMGGASSAAMVIDINGAQPVVTSTQSMSTRRQWVSATVLADGRVLGTGGSDIENTLNGVNNVAEIWNPATGTWTQGTAGSKARLYHSFGLLLPDASVLVGGGGAPGPLVNLNAEIYYPPYLFNSSGALAARPAIVSAPDTVMPGELFQVGVSGAASISKVSFVKTGSTTHSVNMDQRYLSLPFSANGSLLSVQLPSRAGDLPPGYYMLFVLDGQGVPSVSRMVRVGITTAAPATPDYIPAAGGDGGDTFTLACNADEVLVGVRGTTSNFVYQVGPRCVRIDQAGQWVGTPVNRGLTGNNVGPNSFSKTCATNSAISGFKGRFDSYVDQLDFECRALTTGGALTGAGVFLGAVGPNTGGPLGPWRCPSGNPAFALYGRSGGHMDAFGMQCRGPATTVQNNPPTLSNPGSQTSPVGTALQLNAIASDADGNLLSFSALGLPPGLAVNTSTGAISGTPTTAGNYAVALTVSDGTVTASVNFAWTITALPVFTLDPLPASTPKLVGTPVNYTATVRNGVNVSYSWFFDDGTPATAPSSSPTVTHTFANPGIYYVTVTAESAGSPAQSQTVTQVVHLPISSSRPAMSSNIVFDGAANRLWVANQDNNSVSVFNAANNARLAEIPVGSGPRTLAVAPNGRVWVANKHTGTISVIDPATFTVAQTLAMPFGSQPFGVAFSPTGTHAFVTLEAAGSLLKLDAVSGAVVASLPVGRNPRHLAVNADGSSVYVSRFITPPLPGEHTALVQPGTAGGEVVVVAAGNLTISGGITLRHSDLPDFEIQGAGIPNYLGALALSPDGLTAWVPSKQDNVARGTLRNGANLNFQNTVRAVASRIDLVTGSEDLNARVDLDNASLASAAVFDPWGNYLFVALETSREVAVVDAQGHYEIFRFNVGRAPQGLALSQDGSRLYVNNFMDRTVGVFDLTRLLQLGESNVPSVATLPAINTEALSALVLKGKQFFYDARDTRLARDAYLSCASCHNDGGTDGRTWDLTGMGEGLRNTASLRGRGGAHGFLHWSANFDEVQDFEAQIRTLAGGSGLMTDADFATRNQPLGSPKAGVSADLDALAAYVASLNTFANSPHRNADGSMTAAALAGREVFRTANCASCHGGTSFTISANANLQNVGTIKPSSGSRLGAALTGIDVPTLRDVWATAPYLHDGSAPTLEAAITAHGGVSLNGTDLANLVAYVEQIGAQEASPPVLSSPPAIVNPGDQVGFTGKAVNLAISASDPDGDTLTYGAGNLPIGLSINTATGLITGKPVYAGSLLVDVWVIDAQQNEAMVSFQWTINEPDTTAPSKPALTAAVVSGFPKLTWPASTDNAGIDGYIIYRSTNGTQGAEYARVNGDVLSFTDTSFTEKVKYTYSVKAVDTSGNLSALSALRSVTPSLAPTVPTLSLALAGGKPRLSWSASTDNVGVVGYVINRATTNSAGAEVARTGSELTWTDATAVAGTRYYYNVRALDAAGNLSTRSSILSIVSQ